MTPFAEFNIYIDPEAAKSLFGSPAIAAKTTMVTLDLTHLFLATDEVQKGITESPHASKLGMLPADQVCVPADLFISFQPSRGAALSDPARILAVGKRLGCERR